MNGDVQNVNPPLSPLSLSPSIRDDVAGSGPAPGPGWSAQQQRSEENINLNQHQHLPPSPSLPGISASAHLLGTGEAGVMLEVEEHCDVVIMCCPAVLLWAGPVSLQSVSGSVSIMELCSNIRPSLNNILRPRSRHT